MAASALAASNEREEKSESFIVRQGDANRTIDNDGRQKRSYGGGTMLLYQHSGYSPARPEGCLGTVQCLVLRNGT